MDLAIRADGGPEIGFGHLVRTRAIADEALSRGSNVTYLTRTPANVETVCPTTIDTVSLPESKERDAARQWVDHHNPDIVLIDSYEADTDYQSTLRESAETTATILDDTRYVICADYLINGNIYGPELNYEWCGEEPAWCLGLEYLPIRRPIRHAAEESTSFRETPDRAVVTMGGSDIGGTTPAVCQAFDGVGVTIDVIIGPGFENHGEIEHAIAETDAEFNRFEDPTDFAGLIARADFAVSAAGSTVYELLAVGTPTIAIPQAANQEPIARALADRDAIGHLEPEALDTLPDRIEELLSDTARRRILHDRGRELVDCEGARRIYDTLQESKI